MTEERRQEALRMIEKSIRWVRVLRAELQADHSPLVTSRLWQAEQKLRAALEIVREATESQD